MSTGSVTEIEYRQTARLIKVLGGEFHDNLNTITTNLLISDNAAGAKFNFMRQNNRPIVKMDWLKDCVEKVSSLHDYGLLFYCHTIAGQPNVYFTFNYPGRVPVV